MDYIKKGVTHVLCIGTGFIRAPLMSATRYGKVCRMLKSGQAAAVCTKPFTIHLTYEPASKVTQPVTPGIDRVGQTSAWLRWMM